MIRPTLRQMLSNELTSFFQYCVGASALSPGAGEAPVVQGGRGSFKSGFPAHQSPWGSSLGAPLALKLGHLEARPSAASLKS